MSRRNLLIGTGILLAIILIAGREIWLAPHGRMIVHFFDVGQGDSALIVSPSGKQILIDGGPDLSTLEGLGSAMPFFDRTIEHLVLSHPQTDHMLSFLEVLRRYNINAVLMTGVAYDLPRYDGFLTLLKEHAVSIIIADPAKDIDLGDGMILDVIWPPPVLFGKRLKEVNNSSIALRALYRGHGILFTGDMEKEEEDAILASHADIRADVLKVPHHGSKTSSSTGFLLAIRPNLAVISVGRKNSYGHPHPSVMARFAHFGIPVKTTAEEGTITVSFE